MKLVVIRLRGGLGNQMFQYAMGRAVALRCGVPMALDLSWLPANGKRAFELGALSIDVKLASPAQLAFFGMDAGGEPTLRRRLAGVLRRLRRWRGRRQGWIYEEPHFHFDPAVATLTAPVYLYGDWQSEDYFRDIADIVRRELTLRAPLDRANAEMSAAIRESAAVSLHVRRSDYVSDPVIHQKHGTCSLEYYRAAIAHVCERVREPHFYVFSDDLAWARANLRVPHAMTFVGVNPPNRGVYDMHLMSLCRHHIVANSSFSWWGAWLNPSPEKLVIAPRRWFAAAPHDTRDLLPAGWVALA